MSADTQNEERTFFEKVSWHARYDVLYPIEYFLDDASSFLQKPKVALGGLILLAIVATIIMWVGTNYPLMFKALYSVLILGGVTAIAIMSNYNVEL